MKNGKGYKIIVFMALVNSETRNQEAAQPAVVLVDKDIFLFTQGIPW